METITIQEDIEVMYVRAGSFPEGVLQAHQQLHAAIPFSTQRRYFGISRPEQGGRIVYKAATEVLEASEITQYGFDTMPLKKGRYVITMVNDYMKDLSSIARAFNQLLTQPGLDPQGYCVELYISNKDVQCMIRLAD